MDPEEIPDTKDQPGGNPAWRRVQLARHPKRPHSLDYIGRIFQDFQELHGDRNFGDDPAQVEAARLKLATAILSFANNESRDVEVLKKAAIEQMAMDYRLRR